MKKLHIILLTIAMIFAHNEMSYSQFLSGKNAQVLLKGIVLDETTRTPLAVSIEFRTQDNKKIKTQSNENGEFEQLLPSGSEYLILLNSEDILRKEFNFQIEETDSYKEQKTEWTAIKPAIGAKIYSENIFSDASANISNSGMESLKELQKLLRFNRNLSVDFLVIGQSKILQKRIDVVSELVESWTREKSRITIKKGNSKSNKNDLEVYINKISEYLR